MKKSLPLQFIIPAFIGIFAFLLIAGPEILDPQNIAWLAGGDPAQHYLGWTFFRQSEWTFPLGLNPLFGLDLSSAIVFSDSLPILAFLFKPFSAFLPESFQYFGLWILLCFVLQAMLAWKLAGLITQDIIVKISITGFCVFSPIMLWRLRGHISLASHFLILSAFYLYIQSRQTPRPIAWVVLLCATTLIHFYLLAMVGAIWVASLVDRHYAQPREWKRHSLEFLAGLAAGLLVAWQAGYFSVAGGAGSGGYGYFRMNLVSPFDSDGWSHVLKDLTGGGGDYEGFNFLGLGVILLGATVLPALPAGISAITARVRRARALSIVLALLSLFAVSNVVGIGPIDINIPIPGFVRNISNVLRSSGRMFWPVYYVLIFGIFFAVFRVWGLKKARWIFPAALAIQLLDTNAGWVAQDARLAMPPARVWETPMTDPFWDHAARNYSSLRWIMPQSELLHWEHLASYAASHGMGTDAVYLARVDWNALRAANARANAELETGQYQQDSLYVLDDPSARIATRTLDSERDMLATIDGFHVLAPGWRQCADCPSDYAVDPNRLYGPLLLDTDIVITDQTGENYLLDGWAFPEDWGVWSQSPVASLQFTAPLPAHFRLHLTAQAFGPNAGQDFVLRIGDSVSSFQLDNGMTEVTLEIAHQSTSDIMEIAIPEPVSPQTLGTSTDNRDLGIGLARFRIEPLD